MNRLTPLVFVWVLLVTGSARATVTRVLWVVAPADRNQEAKALELQRSGSLLLSKDPRIELVDVSASPESTKQAAQQLAKAAEAIDDVNRLIVQIDYPAAKLRAETALAQLVGADFRVVRDRQLQLLLQLARIRFALKEPDAGSAELTQALVLDPALETPRDMNSKERAWFEARRRALEAEPKSPLVTVESATANGWLWLDGRFVGITPTSLPNVRAGRHFLTFVAPGAEPQHRPELLGTISRIEFTATATAEGRNYLAMVASLAAGFRSGSPEVAARELLAWSKADEVIAVGLIKGDQAVVFRSAKAGVVAPRTLALPIEQLKAQALADASIAAFESPLGPEGAVAEVAPVRAPRPVAVTPDSAAPQPFVPGSDRPVVKQAAPVSQAGPTALLIVSALVAGGGGVLLGASFSSVETLDAAPGASIADPESVAQVGRFERVTGISLLALGAIGITTSVILFVTNHEPVHPVVAITPAGSWVGVAGTWP